MRFVIKAVFWFGLVLLFLPEDALHRSGRNTPPAPDARTVTSTVDMRDALARISRICSERPDLCRRTADAISAIDIDTEKGARMALEILLAAASEPPKTTGN